FDDGGRTVNTLAQLHRDPVGLFTAPADGTYRVAVRERYGKGGPCHAYALRVGTPRPDFAAVISHETPSDPTCPVVRRGGSAHYDLHINRLDGFDGPVEVRAQGLPPGLTCPPVHVGPGVELASVVFTASADAREWSGAVRLVACATVDGVEIEREV